jgi:hypothetical protein
MQESFSRLRVGESPEGIESPQPSKEAQEVCALEQWEGVASLRRRQLSTMGKPLGKRSQQSL